MTIDECFCDLTGIPAAQLESLGRRLREEVQRRTHLTVGVGIAPAKTLAKLPRQNMAERNAPAGRARQRCCLNRL